MKVNEIMESLIYGDKVKMKDPQDLKYKGLKGVVKQSNITTSTVAFEGIKKPVIVLNSNLEKI